MLTPISTKIEEFENEGLPHSTVCYIKTFNDCDKDCPNKVAKDFLRTALEQRDEEWRELVKNEVKELENNKPTLDLRMRQGKAGALYEWNRNENKIEALNDIITKSKENN